MDKIIKEKWIAALNSGKYEQGHGVLCRQHTNESNQYCCLGVLVETTGGEWEDQDPEDKESIDKAYFKGSYEYLPDDYCGLSRDQQRILAELNDGDHEDYGEMDFPAIAKFIEKHVEEDV